VRRRDRNKRKNQAKLLQACGITTTNNNVPGIPYTVSMLHYVLIQHYTQSLVLTISRSFSNAAVSYSSMFACAWYHVASVYALSKHLLLVYACVGAVMMLTLRGLQPLNVRRFTSYGFMCNGVTGVSSMLPGLICAQSTSNSSSRGVLGHNSSTSAAGGDGNDSSSDSSDSGSDSDSSDADTDAAADSNEDEVCYKAHL
jgi:hypothetical protein